MEKTSTRKKVWWIHKETEKERENGGENKRENKKKVTRKKSCKTRTRKTSVKEVEQERMG